LGLARLPLVLFLLTLLFERLSRLLRGRLPGRLICHVLPAPFPAGRLLHPRVLCPQHAWACGWLVLDAGYSIPECFARSTPAARKHTSSVSLHPKHANASGRALPAHPSAICHPLGWLPTTGTTSWPPPGYAASGASSKRWPCRTPCSTGSSRSAHRQTAQPSALHCLPDGATQ